jgi:hypothetical protein
MSQRDHFRVVYTIPGIEAFSNDLVFFDDNGAHHGAWADKPHALQGEINGAPHVFFVSYGWYGWFGWHGWNR